METVDITYILRDDVAYDLYEFSRGLLAQLDIQDLSAFAVPYDTLTQEDRDMFLRNADVMLGNIARRVVQLTSGPSKEAQEYFLEKGL